MDSGWETAEATWESAPEAAPHTQRTGSGVWDAMAAGYQNSATGLMLRGRLPDVVLDQSHSKWYEKAVQGISGTVSDIPEMAAGAVAGGAVGTAAGPVGSILGAGAGTFAVPTLIRESLIQAYSKGDVSGAADFLERASIVIKETGKSAVVGALTAGAGTVAARAVGGAVVGTLGTSAAIRTINAAETLASVGTMTVAPAALEGRLPEPEDFVNAAIVVGGMKAAGAIAGRMAKIYAKTGVEPEQVVADAKADPEIASDLTKDGLPKAYQGVAQQEMLRGAMPDPVKVQEIIANPRGVITDTKEPNHINYNYVEAPEDVVALRARMSEVLKTEIQAARGSESWSATQDKAQEIIRNRLAGMPADQQSKLSSMAFEDLAAQSMAVEAMAQKAAFDARAAASNIAAKGALATPEEIAALPKAIETAALLHAIDQGNGAEIARALNARKAASQRAALSQSMSEMMAKYGEDPHTLAQMVLGLDNTAQITAFAKAASKATTYEKVVEAWKAGILSGPITHMANIVGNGTFVALRPIIDFIASAGGAISGAEERVATIEPFSRILGNVQGAKDALIFAGRAMRVAYGEGGVKGLLREIAVGNDTGPQKMEQFRKAIEGTKGDIVRLPFRALSLADDFFKIVNDQGERYALASRQAAKEGFSVLTHEFRERVADLVQNDEKIATAGEAAALRFTFNTPLGEKGQAVQTLVRKAKLQLVVPFIRTPANIFKEMVRMTPLAPIIGEWRADYAAGGVKQAKAVAEMAMGTAISGVVASFVMDGTITGQGSPDPNKRRVQAAAGWQPYSIKINDKYYSYQRLQPLGTLMGMAADLAEVWEHVTDEEGNKAATMLSVAFANAVTTQTFLSGITNVVQVLADPQRYGSSFVEQYAGSVVPAIIAQPTQMYDPLQREVHGIVDAVKARIPGLRETLEPKINPLTGEAVEAKERVATVAPIGTSDISKDPVLKEALRLGVSTSKAPKSLQLPAMGDKALGKVELTPAQQTMFSSTSGKLAHEILSGVVGTDTWTNAPDIVKKQIFAKVMTQARKAGAAAALPAEERAVFAQAIADSLMQKLQQ